MKSLEPASPDLFQFLAGGGEMGRRIREHDWSQTSLGSGETWPQSLRTTLSIVLNSKFPMFLFWGPEHICFYNDAYRPSLGKEGEGKHPLALGQKAADVWPEIWAIIFPQIDAVMKGGEASWHEDQLVPIYRNGKVEDVYWTYSYSPVMDEKSNVGGVFVTCTETTEKVHNLKRIEESETYFRQLTDTVPAIIWITEPDGSCTYLNQHWYGYTGQTPEEAEGFGWLDVTHPDDKDEAGKIFIEANAAQKPFSLLYRLRNKSGEYRWAKDSGSPKFSKDGVFEGFIGTVVDVHEEKLAEELLRKSEARFQSLVRNATAAIVVLTGPEMKVEIVNEAYGRLIERMPDELLGKPLFSIIPDAEAYYLPILESVRQSGEPVVLYDTPYSVKKGDKIIDGFLHVVYQPYRNTFGSIIGVMAIIQDVTESVKSRKALEESEAKFRSVIGDAPVAIGLFVGRDLIIENPNQAFVDIVGKGWSIVGQPLREAMPELITEGQPYLQILDDVFTTGDMFQTSGSLVKIVQNGVMTDRYYNFTYSPLFNSEGKVWAILDIAIDVTEQIEAREKLKESEEQFRKIAEAIPQLVWVCNSAGEVTYFNQRWYQFTGTNPEQTLGHKWSTLLHPDDVPATLEKWNYSQKTATPVVVEYRLRSADGSYRWIVSHGIPILNNDGSIERWFGTCTDIHERKNFARDLEDKVMQRTKELQQSNDDLQQFAHVASHDLKEPVRKVKIFTSRLEEEYTDALDEKAKLYISKVQKAADRMFMMIDGVLTYSTINAATQMPELIDLTKVIKSIEQDLEILIQQKEATIKYNALPALDGAPVLLYQLFYNLINNSLKFARPGVPPVISIESEITMTKGKEFAQIYIRDNGIGFEQNHAGAIFNTFTRLNSKETYDGTGLGLSLCKKIAERHGGDIKAIGNTELGATFVVSLPLKQQRKDI